MNRKSIRCLYGDIGTEIVRIRMSLMGLDRSGSASHDSQVQYAKGRIAGLLAAKCIIRRYATKDK